MAVNRETIPSFESAWNVEVARGGYLQLPHDFYRNAHKIGLTTTDTMIAIYIMGYEPGSFIAASSVANSYGISIGTVRKSFRRLDKLSLVHRHFQKGGANRFSYSGLKQAVKGYAKLREADQQNRRIGVFKFESEYTTDLDTNKEVSRIETRDLGGYEKYRREREQRRL